MDSRRLALLTVAILAFLSWALPARAFVFSPMSAEFDPSGPGSTRSFTVENDGKAAIAVEFAIYPRVQDLDGNEPEEKRDLAEKRFLVYPPQLLLQPGEKRTLRVTWTGGVQGLSKELPFRIIAEQLRLDTEKKKAEKQGGAMIDLLLKYKGAIYVKPQGAKPSLSLKSAEPVTAKGAKGNEASKLAITFENRGTAHQLLGDVELHVKVGATERVLKPTEIPEISSQNVLAGRTRRFVIPWPAKVPHGKPQVTLGWTTGVGHR